MMALDELHVHFTSRHESELLCILQKEQIINGVEEVPSQARKVYTFQRELQAWKYL